MIKLDYLDRRHVAGIAALALTLAGLGYFGARDFPTRPVAQLPQLASGQIAQLNPEQPQLNENQSFQEKFLSGLQRLPANAYGSAQALKDKVIGNSDSAADAQITPVSPASESKFWSDQEWRIAGKAVDEFRSTRKSETQTQAKKTGTLSWRPPEEIASKAEKAR
ncbi:hypothetical protein [Methylocystis parvus]|uniref:hypothetical protein n=1 Tax=Methylocystis parvus TaxID=134 RepID=UPI003C72D8D6